VNNVNTDAIDIETPRTSLEPNLIEITAPRIYKNVCFYIFHTSF